jgi:Tol biopolymer transport system component
MGIKMFIFENFERVDMEWIKNNIDPETKSFTDKNGIYIVETEMPSDIVNKHLIDSYGTPIRLAAYYYEDKKRFLTNSTSFELFENTSGDESLIAYLDFYKEDKGNGRIDSNIGMLYVRPEYRAYGVARELTDYVFVTMPDGSKLNAGRGGTLASYYLIKDTVNKYPDKITHTEPGIN